LSQTGPFPFIRAARHLPEAKQIEQAARLAGLSKSEFIRKRLLASS
jgi:hypothetical protein